MPSQHATGLISWRSKDPTLRQWIKDEAGRRGVDQKVLLDEALSEYRTRQGYARELAALLNLLETVDRDITPEHVAQRFRELLDEMAAEYREKRDPKENER